MSDPIADLITRIRNAHAVNMSEVCIPYSKFKEAVLKVMHANGYINSYEVKKVKELKNLVVSIKDIDINHIRRLSKPGQRIYVAKTNIPKPLRGMGLVIISTPKGVISGKEAVKLNTGGELICEVW